MRKLYFRLGLFLSISLAGAGGYFFIREMVAPEPSGMFVIIKFLFYSIAGLFIILVTLLSVKRARLRYFSKQFQAAGLYIVGSFELINTGNFTAAVLILIGLFLAYRYSFLRKSMIVFTGLWTVFLISMHIFIDEKDILSGLERIIFVLLIYIAAFLVFADYNKILSRKINRLNNELNAALKITPFGAELKKQIASQKMEDVKFTKKEYELMVSMCFYEKVTNDELSDFLKVSKATVKTHLNNIFKKTGIHSRSRLITSYKDVFVQR